MFYCGRDRLYTGSDRRHMPEGLGMIGFPEVCIHHALATGLLGSTHRFYGDEHRVNFAYKAGASTFNAQRRLALSSA